MSSKQVNHQATVGRVCEALESIAPVALAQEWDNVGLLAGDLTAPVKRVLLCIDLTSAVVDEAIEGRFDFVHAYHPPIFKPIRALRVPSHGTDEAVFRCIRDGVAIYSTHTALDAAEGGTNDVLAEMCGISKTEPLEYVPRPGEDQSKVVVFVPEEKVEAVADAMFEAGAGHIGDYRRCSFRLHGKGTFFGGEGTDPSVGRAGQRESVDEVRLEAVVPADKLPGVIGALVTAHPYEEPAHDIYPLTPGPVRGIGRWGLLAKPTTLGSLAKILRDQIDPAAIQAVGDPDRRIERAVIVAGAAGSLPFRMALTSSDVIITGEIRHHDALTIQRLDCSALALGHWTSERPVLRSLADRLEAILPGVEIRLSEADGEPFQPV